MGSLAKQLSQLGVYKLVDKVRLAAKHVGGRVTLLWVVVFGILLGLGSGCVTTATEKELRRDIFNLQTRLLTIEQLAKSRGFDTDAANQRIASTSTLIEKLQRSTQQVAGEIDAIKVGLKTGRMPGSDPSEPSIESTMNSIIARLDEIDEQQGELLKALSSNGAEAAAKRKGSALANLSTVQQAFKAKRYLHIVQDVPKIIKKTKDKKTQSSLVYYQAESLYKLGKMQESALKFNDYLEGKPDKNLVAHSKMRMGDCFRHLNEKSTARLYYSELIDQYPKSSEAAKARDRLKELDRKGANVPKPKRSKYARSKKATPKRGG